MSNSSTKKSRKCLRLKSYDYSKPGAYFITLCTYQRKCLFGEIENGQMQINEFGKIAQQNWLNLPSYNANIVIDESIVMPNHFHGIIFIVADPRSCRGNS